MSRIENFLINTAAKVPCPEVLEPQVDSLRTQLITPLSENELLDLGKDLEPITPQPLFSKPSPRVINESLNFAGFIALGVVADLTSQRYSQASINHFKAGNQELSDLYSLISTVGFLGYMTSSIRATLQLFKLYREANPPNKKS